MTELHGEVRAGRGVLLHRPDVADEGALNVGA